MITDRVINDIINAEVVIADLSELNPNAFYELGIRHCMARPTIHVVTKGTKLPFDNLGHSAISVDTADWHDLERARSKLKNAFDVAASAEHIATNPVTQAKASLEIQQSANPQDQVMASILARLDRVENNTMVQSAPALESRRGRDWSPKEAFSLLEELRDKVSPGQHFTEQKRNMTNEQIRNICTHYGVAVRHLIWDDSGVHIITDGSIPNMFMKFEGEA